MIQIFALALFILPFEATFINSPIVHLSDSLKLKCDALPYRTAFKGTQCYFADTQEVKLADATKQCASIFSGSRVTTNVPVAIFNAMMLDKSKFHIGKDSSGASFKSSGAKQTICLYESGYKCDVGEQSPIFPGKCIDSSDEIVNLDKARATCSGKGMEMPAVGNELENRMIRGALGKNPAWIINAYAYFVRGEQKWHRQKYYSKYSTCHRPDYLYAGHEQNQACVHALSSVVDHTGYWGNSLDQWRWSSVCVKDAENAFTPVIVRRTCVSLHEWNDETRRCEWKETAPKNACAQLIDFYNRTWFMPMPNFPKETFVEIAAPNLPVDDIAVKVIVRRGYMFFGYRHPRYPFEEDVSVSHRTYGEHSIPCQLTGDLAARRDGISRANCFCDPTEATLNDHVHAPPPENKCIEHHVFNETTQACEWKFESKFCGELITLDGRRQMLEIPNWPKNRKYDEDHWTNPTKREENFHITVTNIIVRQHCWATLYWRWHHERMTLATSGYGKHKVASYYNGMLGNVEDGTHRFVCECIR